MTSDADLYLDDIAPSGAREPHRSLIYKTIANQPPYEGVSRIAADVYAPPGGGPRPVVVFFHGGALINGGRGSVKLGLGRFCVEQGWAMVSADYRLGPEVKVPQILEDVRDLMAWVREKGPELFGADPERIAASGSSAGGYLALAAGTMSPKPKAILSLWGYGDLLADWYTKPCAPYSERDVDKTAAYADIYRQILTETGNREGVPPQRKGIYPYLRHEGLWTRDMTGFDPITQREEIVPLCPRLNVTPDYPPTLLIHGELDDDVPVSESLNMATALKANGVAHELLVLPGAGHTLKNASEAQLAEATAKAQAFLHRQLAAG